MFTDTVNQLGIVSVQVVAPTNPNTGDVWLNSTTQVLSTWDGTTWVQAVGGTGVAAGAGVTVSAVAPATTKVGDLWLDTNSNELKVYNGATWLQSTHDGGRY